jgi:hypothetical protein
MLVLDMQSCGLCVGGGQLGRTGQAPLQGVAFTVYKVCPLWFVLTSVPETTFPTLALQMVTLRLRETCLGLVDSVGPGPASLPPPPEPDQRSRGREAGRLPKWPDVVVHACNPSTWEAEA